MQTVSIAVADEFVALGTAIKTLIVDIKNGKTAMTDIEDTIQALIPAIGSFQNVASDAKLSSNQAYLVMMMLSAFEGN